MTEDWQTTSLRIGGEIGGWKNWRGPELISKMSQGLRKVIDTATSFEANAGVLSDEGL